jgi:hypothetical protein
MLLKTQEIDGLPQVVGGGKEQDSGFRTGFGIQE